MYITYPLSYCLRLSKPSTPSVRDTDYSKVFYCTRHGRFISTNRFGRDRSRKFGYKTQCKTCVE